MHTLIIGMTESGKSTLGKILARELHRRGKRVVVLDPLADTDWKATYTCSTIAEFDAYLKRNRQCYAFVDESGEWFQDGNYSEYLWFATRSRHYGHSMFFLGQRAIQIPKTMRDQCGKLYLFTSSQSDGVLHAEEWNHSELAQCNTLPKLHFWGVGRYQEPKLYRIVDYRRVQLVNRRISNDAGESSRVARNINPSGPMDDGKGKA